VVSRIDVRGHGPGRFGAVSQPRLATETFWVSYAQFMQAAAKDHGLDLRVRYCERNAWIDSHRPSSCRRRHGR